MMDDVVYYIARPEGHVSNYEMVMSTDYERVADELISAKQKINELEKRNSELGWIVSPDRMGQ